MVHPLRSLWHALLLLALWAVLGGCGGGGGGGGSEVQGDGSSTGGVLTTVCEVGESAGPVQAPAFVLNLPGQTSWFASPVVSDLDGDGSERADRRATTPSTSSTTDGNLLDRVEGGDGRVYAPHVVADLEGDGASEIVVRKRPRGLAPTSGSTASLVVKPGWPADTTTARRVAGGPRAWPRRDLDGNGTIEIVVTTTQTQPTAERGRAGLRVRLRRLASSSRRAGTYRPGRATTLERSRATTRTGTGRGTTATAATA